MNPEEKRGRLYLIAFIAVLVIGEVLTKSLLLAFGGLRWTQAVGTVITLMACWFLWRGSKVAYGFMVFCTAAALVLTLLASGILPLVVTALIFTLTGALLAALLAPATRKFVAYRRAASA